MRIRQCPNEMICGHAGLITWGQLFTVALLKRRWADASPGAPVKGTSASVDPL